MIAYGWRVRTTRTIASDAYVIRIGTEGSVVGKDRDHWIVRAYLSGVEFHAAPKDLTYFPLPVGHIDRLVNGRIVVGAVYAGRKAGRRTGRPLAGFL